MSADLSMRIDKARWWALSNHPFYGALLARLEARPGPVKTMATDGRVILYGAEFVSGLTDEELRGVLLHEVLHCAHGHHWRLKADSIGNQAGDYEINGIVGKIPGCKLPAGGLVNPDFDNLA